MKRHLPPLNALRAFEAAARHQSFTKAADELFVTPGAVSRQVQVLEEHLGTSLFTRLNREVVITAEGQIYRDSLTKAFDQINMSTQSFKNERSLMIGSYLTFAMKWLVPRMGGFMEKYPKHPITLSRAPNLSDVSSGTIDIAIMGGPDNHEWPGLVAHKLFPNIIEPVVTPEFLEAHPLNEPKDLFNVQLLQSAARPDDWNYWLEQSGHAIESASSVMTFETSCLCFNAALNNVGAAIGQVALLQEELKSGKLVRPFNKPQHDGWWFYLTYSTKFSELRAVTAFKDWMLEEIEQFNKGVI